MKKIVAFVAAILSAAVVLAQDVPSWYSEDVKVSEKEISRKDDSGKYVPFIDKSFTACTFVKVEGEIDSLYAAQNKGEEIATKKLTDYLKKNKETAALAIKPKLVGWSYDYSLETGGTYVMVEVVTSAPKPQTPVAARAEAEEIRNMSSSLPRILLYKNDRLTLVDQLNMNSQESKEAHRLEYTGKGVTNSTSKESFYYSDGVLVYDTVVRVKGGNLKFNLKNVIKGRKTLIVARVDCGVQDQDYVLTIGGIDYKANVKRDQKNRWVNVVFEVEEGVITTYSPDVLIKSNTKSSIAVGSIAIYQLL